MVRKFIKAITDKNEDAIKEDLKKLKEELKDLRNNKAANANSAKAAKIKVLSIHHADHPQIHRQKPHHHQPEGQRENPW